MARKAPLFLSALDTPEGVLVSAAVRDVTERRRGEAAQARFAANAELTAAGQVRFVVPTVYRNNYLAALNAISNGAGRGESLVAVLAFAQRWTAAVRWNTFEGAKADLDESNAFVDPGIADVESLSLRLPPKN